MTLQSVLSWLPPSPRLSLSLSQASPSCDCSATVTVTILSVGQTSHCAFFSWLAAGHAGQHRSLKCFRKVRKNANRELFDRNLHPQQSLKPGSWGDLLKFHFSWSFFFFLPPSQNKWVIRAETFPHTPRLSECRAAFVSSCRQTGFTNTVVPANITAVILQ